MLIYVSANGQGTNIKFQHITTDDGLSTGTVDCVFKDSRGYLWLGTWNGLNRYNAYSIELFEHDPKDPNSVAGGRVTSIIEDNDRKVWFGTNGNGISVFDYNTQVFTHFKNDPSDPNSIPSNVIRELLKDESGRILIASPGGGVSLYNPGDNNFTNFRHDPSNSNTISSNMAFSILHESGDKFWVGCNSGSIDLLDISTGQVDRIVYDTDYSANANRKPIMKDDKGIIWIGTDGLGIYKVNPDTRDFERIIYDPLSPGGLNFSIITFFKQINGNIWIGTDGGGINIYNPANGTFKYMQSSLFDATSLSSDAVYSLYQDDSDIYWISTFRGGINYYSPHRQKFKYYHKEPGNDNSLAFNSVISVADAPNGKIWIGTDGGGLDLFDPATESFEHRKHSASNRNSLSGNVIKNIFTDSKGIVWLGTYSAGMTSYDMRNNRYTRFLPDADDDTSIGGPNIWSIIEDADNPNILWVAVLGIGLDKYDRTTGEFTHFANDPNDDTSLSSNQVVVIYEDSNSNFWVGTDQGLNLFDKNAGTFKRFIANPDDPDALPNPDIRTIMESNGKIYIGTADGLCIYDASTGNFQRHPVNDQIPNKVINGLLEDNAGNLWVATSFGLAKYDGNSGEVIVFDKNDGLQGNEFNYTSSIRSNNGYMVFGGTEGFNIFKPENIVLNDFNAPVVFTSFNLFDNPISYRDTVNGRVILEKPLSELKNLILTHKENVFSIEFASLDYTTPSRNKYMYKLEGFDEKWIEVGADKRVATYMNLSPGDYTFTVQATNSDGILSTHQKSLNITILPPWWLTWWFLTIASVFIIAAVIGIYQWRVRSLKQQRVQLRKEVIDRTSSLEQMINIIRSNSEQITETGRSLKQKSGELASDAQTQDANAREIEEALQMVTENTKRSSENAQVTNQISENTVKQLEHIRSATLKNIQEIKSISDKIKVLEELFKQTNILAINASIEAARAGEFGTGFSVIAGEVRKLAERSREASNEIVELAKSGVKETEQVGSLIMEFIPEVQKAAGLIHEISEFSHQQNQSIGNVNASLKSFFRISKKNTEVSGEIHEISSELDTLAKYLNEQVKSGLG